MGVTSSDANEQRKTIVIAVEIERKRRIGQWREAELSLVHFLRGVVLDQQQQQLLGLTRNACYWSSAQSS